MTAQDTTLPKRVTIGNTVYLKVECLKDGTPALIKLDSVVSVSIGSYGKVVIIYGEGIHLQTSHDSVSVVIEAMEPPEKSKETASGKEKQNE